MVDKQETKKEVKSKYLLGSVVTGTAPTIICDDKAMTLEEALVELLNKVDKLERNLG